MAGTDISAIPSTQFQLQKCISDIKSARKKHLSVAVGNMKGRLVIKVTPQWNLLQRVINWFTGLRASGVFKASMLKVLDDPFADRSLKQQVFDLIVSGQSPGFSHSECHSIRGQKSSYFQNATITEAPWVLNRVGLQSVQSEELDDWGDVDASGPTIAASEPVPPPVALAADSSASFIGDDLQKQAMIDDCRASRASGEVCVIRRPADFEQDNLVHTLSCSGQGVMTRTPGRLFTSEPVMLVLDFTRMSAGQIASLNELFDAPPRYQGRMLGENVTLRCLVSKKMLANTGGNPGPDFWRRMDNLGLKPAVISTSETVTDQALLDSRSTDGNADKPPQKENLRVDFYQEGEHWRSLLFGGFQLTTAGRLSFRQGLLAQIQNAPATVELVNAPRDDPEFVSALATAYRNGGFWANGDWVSLNAENTLAWSATDVSEINRLLEAMDAPSDEKPYVGINSYNFDAVMSDIALQDNQLCKSDTLQALVGEGQAVCVTDTLLPSQWIRLLRRMHQLEPVPALAVMPKSILPAGFELKPFVMAPAVSGAGASTASAEVPFEYFIDSRTSAANLLIGMEMTSQLEMTFSQQTSPLMDALLAGRPVHLHGLDSNPDVAHQLESLLCNEPYVFHGGRKRLLPPVHLTLTPTTDKPLEGLWTLLPASSAQRVTEISQEWLTKMGLDKANTQSWTQQLTQLMKAVKTLPVSSTGAYPKAPQMLSEAFKVKVLQQLEREVRSDQSDDAKPYHWRKALNDVVAKEYRGDRQAYGFVKSQIIQAFPESEDSVARPLIDKHAVRQWFQAHPDCSREQVSQDYWSLARYLSSELLVSEAKFRPVSKQAVTQLLPLLCGCLESPEREQLAERLSCTVAVPDHALVLDGSQYRRLYNALMAAGPEGRLQKDVPIHQQALEAVKHLSNQPGALSADTASKESVQAVLQELFTPALLAGDFADLQEAFLSKASSKEHHIRQQRRVVRLAEKVDSTPLVMLKGEAGTGKTHTAFAVACQHQPNGEPLVLSLSPEHTQEELFGHDVLRPVPVTLRKSQLTGDLAGEEVWQALAKVATHADDSQQLTLSFHPATKKALAKDLTEAQFHNLVETFSDSATAFEPGPVLKWAQMEEPPVLILDEANLVKTGVLHPLLGLLETPPSLSYRGRVISLTDKHRVILTGNPESYDGRVLDTRIREKALTLYYRPMSEEVLNDCIVMPGLPEQWPEPMRRHTAAVVMDAYHRFRSVLPQHTFGPRDLKDILARITTEAVDRVPAKEQVNALVWRAVSESLGGEVGSEGQRKLRALQNWFYGHYPSNNQWNSENQQDFKQFYRNMARANGRDGFDYRVPSVQRLGRQVWRELEKQGGKKALIIEGEAGRGKDALLDRLLPAWLNSKGRVPEFDRINASPENWDEIKALVKTAMENGRILVISELNTLPSRYLEGLFNEVLNGQGAEGFRLIATVNPATYSGRTEFSEAMQSRCTKVVIPSFGREELAGLMHRRYPAHSELVDWLTRKHCDLAEQLDRAGSSVRLPLAKLMASMASLQDLSPPLWEAAFDQSYQLARMALSDVKAPPSGSSVPSEGRNAREQKLCQILNRHSEQPVSVQLVERNGQNRFDPQTSALELVDSSDEEGLLNRATELIASADSSRSSHTQEKLLGQCLQVLRQVNQQEQADSEAQDAERKARRQAMAQAIKKEEQEPPIDDPHLEGMAANPPSGMMARILSMSVSKAAWLLSKMSPERVVQLLTLLPLEKLVPLLARLAMKLPVSTLVNIAMKLPLDKLSEGFQDMDSGTMNSLAKEVEASRIKEMMDKLALEDVEKVIKDLPAEKLSELLTFYNNSPASQKIVSMLADLVMEMPREELTSDSFISRLKGFDPEDLVTLLRRLEPGQAQQLLSKLPMDKLTELSGRVVPEVQETINKRMGAAPGLEAGVAEGLSNVSVDLGEKMQQLYAQSGMAVPQQPSSGRLFNNWLAVVSMKPDEKLKDVTLESGLLEQAAAPGLDMRLLDRAINLIPQGLPLNKQLAKLRFELCRPKEGGHNFPYEALSVTSDLPKSYSKKDMAATTFNPATFYRRKSGKETPLVRLLQGVLVNEGFRSFSVEGRLERWFTALQAHIDTSNAPEEINRELPLLMSATQDSELGVMEHFKIREPGKRFLVNSWQLLQGFEKMYQNRKISHACWCDILGRAVFRFPGVPAFQVIGYLDVLEGHPEYGEQAAQMIDRFYNQKITTLQTLPERYQPSVSMEHSVPTRLSFLESRLGQQSIEAEWGNTFKGEAPDIERHIRRAPAFRAKATFEDKPTVVMALNYFDVLAMVRKQLREKPLLNLSRYGLGDAKDVEMRICDRLVKKLTQSLSQYQDKAHWRVVVPQPLYGSGSDIPAGSYGFEAMPVVLEGKHPAKHFFVTGRRQTADAQTTANLTRIAEKVAGSQAIVMDKPAMAQCVAELLDQLSYDELYKMAFE